SPYPFGIWTHQAHRPAHIGRLETFPIVYASGRGCYQSARRLIFCLLMNCEPAPIQSSRIRVLWAGQIPSVFRECSIVDDLEIITLPTLPSRLPLHSVENDPVGSGPTF